MRPKSKSFNDLDSEFAICVSCKARKTTKYTMRGACGDSYLETEYFPTTCKGYVGFIGNHMSIWYVIAIID